MGKIGLGWCGKGGIGNLSLYLHSGPHIAAGYDV